MEHPELISWLENVCDFQSLIFVLECLFHFECSCLTVAEVFNDHDSNFEFLRQNTMKALLSSKNIGERLKS